MEKAIMGMPTQKEIEKYDYECPFCKRNIHIKKETNNICYHCGKEFNVPYEIFPKLNKAFNRVLNDGNDGNSPTLKLNCKACDQEKTMAPTKINKFSPIVVLIGWILVIPSILGMFWAFSSIFALGTSELSETVIGFGAIIAFCFIGIPSLVMGLLGYLLIMKKKVFKCIKCDFIMDRA